MTKIEVDAWWDWKKFLSTMSSIWNTYSRYGDVVLEKDLEEDDKNLKPFFVEANGSTLKFTELIRKYWEENYHFVAGNYEELANIFMHYKKQNLKGSICELYLLPETGNYQEGETRGYQQTYSVTAEFYDKVKSDIARKNGKKDMLLIMFEEKKCFELNFQKKILYTPMIHLMFSKKIM